MSYVPATFTAGFALVLTAAGAIGGQWVSDIQQAVDERAAVKTEARSRTHLAPVTPVRAAAVALETSSAVVELEAIEMLGLDDLEMSGASAVRTLHAPTETPSSKVVPAEQPVKPRPSSPPRKK